jgi:hypothetical protein
MSVHVGISGAVGRDLVQLAHQRNDPKERFNQFSDWRVGMDSRGKASSLDNHVLGLLGEYAAGQVLGGVDVDRQVWTSKGDGGVGDLFLPCGATVQVKTRLKEGWDFALSGDDPQELQADFAVLCYTPAALGALLQGGRLAAAWEGESYPRGAAIDVYGYASRDWFVKKAVVKNYGYGNRIVLEPWCFEQVFLRCIPANRVCEVLGC